METKSTPQNIDEYIAGFPENVQALMKQLRTTINETAPEAKEKISWGMATFALEGNLIHFAGNKKHIGIYPGAEVIEVFKEKLSAFKTSKGAIQFPLDKPMPLQLVAEIVSFNVKQRKEEAERRRKGKKKNKEE
ncbi:MAG: DUF1801 domain-containing protein [Tannerellaceae bacterium]|nr:DUF1801 domain-containing protein [Tannerellaceae bacterium]